MTEHVVLLDEDGRPTGAMDKAVVHGADTPLHLGFSCYVFDPAGELLITRRAAGKRSFGGLWTNTVCGHPAPDEAHEDAVRRRAEYELGLPLHDVQVVLPDFRYRAEHAGLVENELCPVFLARTDAQPSPLPAEVDGIAWWSWQRFREESAVAPDSFSPWCLEQSALLDREDLLSTYAQPVSQAYGPASKA